MNGFSELWGSSGQQAMQAAAQNRQFSGALPVSEKVKVGCLSSLSAFSVPSFLFQQNLARERSGFTCVFGQLCSLQPSPFSFLGSEGESPRWKSERRQYRLSYPQGPNSAKAPQVQVNQEKKLLKSSLTLQSPRPSFIHWWLSKKVITHMDICRGRLQLR